ncbi:MAG: EAL domain-containing protein [Geminicoccaceae bacterium]
MRGLAADMRGVIARIRAISQVWVSWTSRRAITPVAALVGMALLLSGVGVRVASMRQDVLQQDSERRIIAQNLRALGRTLSNSARDYAWWDDAVRFLVLAPDPAWADANLGAYIAHSFGYELAAVFDGRGRAVYGQVDGRAAVLQAKALLGPEFDGLLLEVARRHRPGAEPEPAFAVLQGRNGLFATAASPIVPEAKSRLAAPPGPSSVLVFAKRLDHEFLAGLEADYGIAGLAFAADGGVGPDRAALALPGPTGKPAAYIVWRPQRPGTGQLVWMLPALLGALLFCAFTAMVVRARDRGVQAVRDSEARFRDIAAAASDWIWETDADLRLIYVSEQCRQLLGTEPQELVGRDLRVLFLPAAAEVPQAQTIGSLAAAGPFQGAVYRCRGAGGESCVLRVAGRPVLAGGRVVGYRGTATDVTSEIAALEQARFLAQHDALTGLPNRLVLHDRLEQALSRCERHHGTAALLCLDLDGFKEVNDALGHGHGDLLLARCADRLRACVRAGDTVTRHGGDEFIVLQTDVAQPADVAQLCTRILDSLSEPFDLDGHLAPITASVGVALAPADAGDATQLLQRADLALYRAKTGGRNRYCFFEPGMDDALRQRRRLEAELRQALAVGQLELHYQPQVDLASGAVIGLEALVRWRHPERGIVLPAEFVPLAEATGVIVPLGAWVLQAACRDAACWGGLPVSVNVSPVQFRQRDLPAVVRQALTAAGLAPERLELEVTESVLVDETGDPLATLGELRTLGVRIAMDDFGTGYSSLSYLTSLPIGTLKIDHSFVTDIDRQDGGNRGILAQASISLGHSLNLNVIAEGVENESQLQFLKANGCDEAQGYYFSKPMPPQDCARLLAASQRPAITKAQKTHTSNDVRTATIDTARSRRSFGFLATTPGR